MKTNNKFNMCGFVFPAVEIRSESRMYLAFTLVIDVWADWAFTLYVWFKGYKIELCSADRLPTLSLLSSSLFLQ